MSDLSGFSLTLPPEFVKAFAVAVAKEIPVPQPIPNGDGRLAYRPAEAAEAIGVSLDFLQRHVLPEVRVVRKGRLRLIKRAELERWLDHNAARLGSRDPAR